MQIQKFEFHHILALMPHCLCVCSSRKGTSDTALHLYKDAQREHGRCGFAGSQRQADCLAAAVARVADKHLQQAHIET